VSNSQAIEDYAKAIYAISAERDGLVLNGEVAERLEVTPATATSMLQKLDGLGLAEYVPYKGVRLTPAGEKVALEVIRHHRLIEAYLSEALGMPSDRVHEEAEVLEHYISEELEELIAAKLGDPTVDPHGDPIPSRELKLAEISGPALAELEPGDSATFVRISDSEPEMLRFLGERGIVPGTRLELVERQPFDGPLFVRVGEDTHVLGATLARAMHMRQEDKA
jgi:DtxR family Mn-dependent transcriptional regulator